MEISDENHDKFSRSLNSGIDALMKTIKGERQAYSLDDDQAVETADTVEKLSDAELHDRIRELTQKLGYV